MMRFFLREKGRIETFLRWLRNQDGEIRLSYTIKAKEAIFGDFGDLDPQLVASLEKKGIQKLWSHQSKAFRTASAGNDIIAVTPTASGKTLCYDLPVLDSILKRPSAKALYLFPTKALAQDQMNELRELSKELSPEIKCFTYDGDTPSSTRREIKNSAGIIITNPDMLNSAILPHHIGWAPFFKNLSYIVVDELHTYRGVLGSHLANIFVRLIRICRHYCSDPVFICSSATIANPEEHAQMITGRPAVLIDQSGAPAAQKKLIVYDPCIIDKRRRIRRSSLYESRRLAYKAICSDICSILFTKTRINVELLVRGLKHELSESGKGPEFVRGYRSGYTPAERRKTERDLRNGKLKTVVSTNALELGIDVGSLDLVIIHGFPGSIASLWQQIGRAGRRNDTSAAVIIPSALPLDRFIARSPEWLLGSPPEKARIDPLNPYVRLEHIKCSIYELPFRSGETFGGEDITAILEFLSKEGITKVSGEGDSRIYSWKSDEYPASSFSIRSASGEKYDIFDITEPQKPRKIGTADRHSAARMIFPGASYFHNGTGYSVKGIDRDKGKCLVKRSDSNTLTEAEFCTRVKIRHTVEAEGLFGWGDTRVSALSGIYRIIDIDTRKVLGHGKVPLPGESIDTTSLWIKMPAGAASEPGLLSAMEGLANLLRTLAPLFLMCDSNDICVSTAVSEPNLRQPAIFLSDSVPGGVGLAEGAYCAVKDILKACSKQLKTCRCRDGCPSCIGTQSGGRTVKKLTKELLENLLSDLY